MDLNYCDRILDEKERGLFLDLCFVVEQVRKKVIVKTGVVGYGPPRSGCHTNIDLRRSVGQKCGVTLEFLTFQTSNSKSTYSTGSSHMWKQVHPQCSGNFYYFTTCTDRKRIIRTRRIQISAVAHFSHESGPSLGQVVSKTDFFFLLFKSESNKVKRFRTHTASICKVKVFNARHSTRSSMEDFKPCNCKNPIKNLI